MHERESRFVAEDLGAHERLYRRGGRLVAELGKRSGVA